MVAHTLPQTKKNGGIGVKPKNIVTYQVGVDVLEFPIYAQHTIYTGTTKGNRINPTKTPWVTVQEKIIKQH